ncbi:MAG: hypothetical protein UT61_C0010G0003 [Candidatus Woesebacteria bacterium GW2011_GWA1_39_8]|jgi:hypothetical protein|uniref:Uncharacterized protein n=1 Tax=Candidatus Woesebacteria bacterium GW2011_GWA1_39_8 TaxID=1618552 RepID=A0A0G0S682_9BACT|nr:MAG: hypothetical protein UT61_C0010G0003 [Candidatus Woesebacteria bacterium GW2011_GWA1_39_8]
MGTESRHGKVWNALGRLKANKRLVGSELENFVKLKQEQDATQIALQNLGVDSSTQPNHIPLIETPIIGRNNTGRPKISVITLIGMPNAGKSTYIDQVHEDDISHIVFDDAGKSALNAQTDKNLLGVNYDKLVESQVRSSAISLSSTLDELYFRHVIGEDLPNIRIIYERDYLDLEFMRASFLFGRFDIRTLRLSEDYFIETLDRYERLPRTVVNCLVSPVISLERDPEPEKYHAIVQEPFLNCLYEQCLRFHWEVGNFNSIFGRPLPFNYVATDMSQLNKVEGINRLKEIINEVEHIASST